MSLKKIQYTFSPYKENSVIHTLFLCGTQKNIFWRILPKQFRLHKKRKKIVLRIIIFYVPHSHIWNNMRVNKLFLLIQGDLSYKYMHLNREYNDKVA